MCEAKPPPHVPSWCAQGKRYLTIHLMPPILRQMINITMFPSGFPTKTLYASLFSPICATCPAHLVHFDLITRIIFGDEYRS